MVGKKEKQGFKAMFKRMLASRLAAGIAAALAALLLLVPAARLGHHAKAKKCGYLAV